LKSWLVFDESIDKEYFKQWSSCEDGVWLDKHRDVLTSDLDGKSYDQGHGLGWDIMGKILSLS